MTATLDHLTGRTLPQGTASIRLDTSGTFSDTALIEITTRGRDAGPTVIDTGIPAADMTGQHIDFRGEVLAQGTGRTSALLRHTLTVGGKKILTAVFLHSGRIKGIYVDAPDATARVFDSAAEYGDWAREAIRQRDPIPAAS